MAAPDRPVSDSEIQDKIIMNVQSFGWTDSLWTDIVSAGHATIQEEDHLLPTQLK